MYQRVLITDVVRGEIHVDLPGSEIIGLRIIIVHKYFGGDERVIWDIIPYDLPNLDERCNQIIESLSEYIGCP